MNRMIALAVLVLAVSGLAGCGTLDRLTGQTDDKVLPGQREDALPGRSQFPEQPVKAGSSQPAESPAQSSTDPVVNTEEEPPPCPADDPNCVPPKTDDTFSDGQ